MYSRSLEAYLPKDFIETVEGLVFAVVAPVIEHGKVLCFLRYVKKKSGWEKMATEAANDLLQAKYPQYLFYSKVFDAYLHAVDTVLISRHYRPKEQLQTILSSERQDEIQLDLVKLCQLFQQCNLDLSEIGVTGSLLIDAQTRNSDIDIVCYSRQAFHQVRNIIKSLITHGQLSMLETVHWQESYLRRSCDLSYEQYVWHEQRKFNKALINERKFDLNLILPDSVPRPSNYRKLGAITLTCKVTDDFFAFDYPAEFIVEHESISSVVAFTATYYGQAFAGEVIEVAGLLEQSETGHLRIVVGSSREAKGEYIRVVQQ